MTLFDRKMISLVSSIDTKPPFHEQLKNDLLFVDC